MPRYVIEGREQEEEPEEVVEIVEEAPPTQEANGDDLSNLFQAPSRNDIDMKTDDLVEVNEEDVFGEGGEDMSDLTEVTNEDVMGEESPFAPSPRPSRRIIRRVKRTSKPYHNITPSGTTSLRY